MSGPSWSRLRLRWQGSCPCPQPPWSLQLFYFELAFHSFLTSHQIETPTSASASGCATDDGQVGGYLLGLTVRRQDAAMHTSENFKGRMRCRHSNTGTMSVGNVHASREGVSRPMDFRMPCTKRMSWPHACCMSVMLLGVGGGLGTMMSPSSDLSPRLCCTSP